ncbi:type I methionyl aminopeptidase [Eubacteriales bacterium OttesenSCG-928-M02]|nr:type I methionyl aminopeptidase [Eubacteriales bacterium OttesenSCG-928-M02]
MIVIKTADEIKRMQEAGAIAARARELLVKEAQVGMTTLELDAMARDCIVKAGAKPSFYHYNGYPGNVCISLNDEVVHGIPSDRKLEDGDVVSVDVGAYIHGVHGDTADSVQVGTQTEEATRLMEVTRQSFYEGLKYCYPGKRVGDIGHAVQMYVEAHGYGVVRALTGHGVGKHLHEDPQVPNYGRENTGDYLKPGMTIAIEPMVNQGTHRVYTLEDDWTVVTADGKLSAHYEHSVAITDGEPILLTQWIP